MPNYGEAEYWDKRYESEKVGSYTFQENIVIKYEKLFSCNSSNCESNKSNTYYRTQDSPFDWLFDYSELSPIIEYLLPDKEELTLLIGCGNAPFSPDL